MTFRRTIFVLLGLMLTPLFMTSPSPSHAAVCKALPDVAWWSSDPAKITRSVTKRYKGDWARYISRWEKYQVTMERMLENGETAVVKSRNIRLEGAKLEAHIIDIKSRISVLNCLREKDEELQAAALENLETAAGGNEPATPAKPTESASVDDGNLDVDVSATCKNNNAVFQVTNLGAKWPRLGVVNIYRTSDKALLVKRRIRMRNSQQATFQVKRRPSQEVTEVGIFVQPTWFSRGFKYDTKIHCR